MFQNEKCEKTKSLGGVMSDDLWKKIKNTIPRFIYYSEYGNLDADLFLRE